MLCGAVKKVIKNAKSPSKECQGQDPTYSPQAPEEIVCEKSGSDPNPGGVLGKPLTDWIHTELISGLWDWGGVVTVYGVPTYSVSGAP